MVCCWRGGVDPASRRLHCIETTEAWSHRASLGDRRHSQGMVGVGPRRGSFSRRARRAVGSPSALLLLELRAASWWARAVSSDRSAALASAPLRLVRRLGWYWLGCRRLGWCWFGWCWFGHGCRLGTGVLVHHGLGHSAPGRDRYAVLGRPRPYRRGVSTLWPPMTALATPGAGVYPACPACHGDELLQAVPQAFGVLGGQVDFIRPAVDSELNCFSCLGAVDVVDELDGGGACQQVPPGRIRCLFAMRASCSSSIGSLV